MRFLEASHGSPLYQAAVELRTESLRQPLGLTFSDDQLAEEVNDYHIVAIDSDHDDPAAMVACLTLSPVPGHPTQLHLRQMAVAKSERRKGVGSQLMDFAENFARARDITEIKLHSRYHAIPFYQKIGYHPVGDPFIEVTLPHQEMRKSL